MAVFPQHESQPEATLSIVPPPRSAGELANTAVILGQLPHVTVSMPAEDSARATASIGERQSHATIPATGLVAYRLERIIGKGGMGQVWSAEQTSLGRRVAVKRLLHPTGDAQRID